MILELCVTELEDVASDTETGRNSAQPVTQESPHPYTDNASLSDTVKIPGMVEILLYLILTYHPLSTHSQIKWLVKFFLNDLIPE